MTGNEIASLLGRVRGLVPAFEDHFYRFVDLVVSKAQEIGEREMTPAHLVMAAITKADRFFEGFPPQTKLLAVNVFLRTVVPAVLPQGFAEATLRKWENPQGEAR